MRLVKNKPQQHNYRKETFMCTKIYYIGLLTMIYSVFFVSDLYAQGNVVCDLDGVVEEGERCDDGNAFNCDSCTNDCQPGPQLDFVLMVEGSFSMGNARNRSARPVHDVDIDSFLGIDDGLNETPA